MHMHTKTAQFSIYCVHFIVFPCSLSLLVLAALHLRAGACWVLPKAGRGLGFAPIRGLGTGLGWGIHLQGGCRRGGFGPGLGGLLSLRLGVMHCGLGGRLSRLSGVRLGVRLLFGLLGSRSSLLLIPMRHYCSMRGMRQMPLNAKHLIFPLVFHPHSLLPQERRSQPPGRHRQWRA